MNISEMHIQFRMLAQQMGMQTVRAIFPEQIDLLLQQSILEITTSIFSRKANRELNGVSDNVIRLAELENLYTNKKIKIEKSDILFGRGYKIDTNTFDKRAMYLLSVNSFTGGVVNKCRLIELDKVSETNADYHSKSTINSPICYNDLNSIEVLADKFDIDNILINYITYPAEVNLENNIDCDIASSLHYSIVERAVNLFNASANNASYEKVSNETQK